MHDQKRRLLDGPNMDGWGFLINLIQRDREISSIVTAKSHAT
jgi:hypothetical protein